MTTNFISAVNAALKKLEELESRGVIKIGKSVVRSISIGELNELIDLKAVIKKAEHDYEAFAQLKRYSATLIRKKQSLPPTLLDWITGYLDDMVAPPKRKAGAPTKGAQINMLLPQLINSVAKGFGLNPSRNDTSPGTSACDAVSEAVIKFNKTRDAALRLTPESYSALKVNYFDAKRKSVFN